MPISFACRCGKRFSLPDKMAEKSGKCTACGERIVIPAVDPSPETPWALASEARAEAIPAQADEPRSPPQAIQRPIVQHIHHHHAPTEREDSPYPAINNNNNVQVINKIRVGGQSNGFATASIVFGVLALLICWIPVFGVSAIPLAGIGLLLALIQGDDQGCHRRPEGDWHPRGHADRRQ